MPNAPAEDTAPYYQLGPDTILQAIDSTGLMTDGRLLPLNSYENRVYQAGLEDSEPVIAKFYRPGRWSDEQILEEHAFSLELEEAEIPLVAPTVIGGETLFFHGGFRFALFRRQGGHAPELDDRETLKWLGRFIGRIHAVAYTHEHADHLFGLDDLRIFPRYLDNDLPVYCGAEVEDRGGL